MEIQDYPEIALKDKQMKSVAASASLSAVLGITEPAMYGVNLRYKRPFGIAMASSAVAAAFLSFFHAGAMAYAPPGIFTIITYTADSFVFIILGAALSFGLAALLTFFFGIPKEENKASKEEKTIENENDPEADTLPDTSAAAGAELTVYSPIHGNVVPLSEVPDEAFGSGAMGQGVGIEPDEGKVYAPFDGTVEMVFDTKHAIGLTSSDGISLLIHVGLDTVELNGQYFTAHVSAGDPIRRGQLLLEFDLDKIAEKYKTVTPVLVVNTDEYASVSGISGIKADNDTPVIKINA